MTDSEQYLLLDVNMPRLLTFEEIYASPEIYCARFAERSRKVYEPSTFHKTIYQLQLEHKHCGTDTTTARYLDFYSDRHVEAIINRPMTMSTRSKNS
jgi:hypothetical protein